MLSAWSVILKIDPAIWTHSPTFKSKPDCASPACQNFVAGGFHDQQSGGGLEVGVPLHGARLHFEPAAADLEEPSLDREECGAIAILGVGLHGLPPHARGLRRRGHGPHRNHHAEAGCDSLHGSASHLKWTCTCARARLLRKVLAARDGCFRVGQYTEDVGMVRMIAGMDGG